jgi:hypothetical protein
MASTFTDLLRLEKQNPGENEDTWGNNVNTVFELVEDAITGMATVSTTGGTTTLTTNNSVTDESRMAILKITGTLTSNAIIVVPSSVKKYTVWNAAVQGAYTVSMKTSAGTAVVLGAGKSQVMCDAASIYSLGVPGGTVMAFFQATAPIGWTQVTTHNNKAIRIVSGTGAGTGGTVAFTTAFASQAVSGTNSDTTLAQSQIPKHTHTYSIGAYLGAPVRNASSADAQTGLGTTEDGTVSGLGGLGHTHPFTGTAINLAVQYIDMILASKD